MVQADSILKNYERIVIKVGSALLVDHETGLLREEWLKGFVQNVMDLQKRGLEVIVVSSGSVALGRNYLNIPSGQKLSLEEKQAAAACGQSELIQNYCDCFKAEDGNAAQILITIADTEDRRRYMNANNTIQTLLDYHVVPIINENDSITTKQLRFGDNDRLSARIAQMTDSDLLILLSDVDGLYDANPHKDPEAEHIPLVTSLDEHVKAYASDETSVYGTGGMATKILAAEIAIRSGTDMIICDGRLAKPIAAIEENAKFTLFKSSQSKHSAKKQWLLNSQKIEGKIRIDAGAVNALSKGNSLLAVGVTEIMGSFDRGDAVEVLDADDNQVGVGLVAYSTAEANMIKGLSMQQIEMLLPHLPIAALIHRDNLVVDRVN